MSWSQNTKDALHNWLAPETSYKTHPIDDIRFFVFIGYVWKDTHQLWDESGIRDILRQKIKELHPDWPSELTEDVIERARSKGTLILDFLCGLKDTRNLNSLLPIK